MDGLHFLIASFSGLLSLITLGIGIIIGRTDLTRSLIKKGLIKWGIDSKSGVKCLVRYDAEENKLPKEKVYL